MGLYRFIGRAPLILFGALLALLVAEIGLRFVEFGPHDGSAAGYRRLHYLYTQTGLGKCYPSDPREYFPFDLSSEEGFAALGPLIADVTDVPGAVSLAERIDYLRQRAPHCNNIELRRLNGGPHPDRGRRMLIVGDSFAFGEGLRIEDTLGYVMGEREADYNFPNMAWPGSSTETVLDVARSPLGSEAVLYFYNINDVALSEPLLHRRDRLHDEIREAKAAARGWADAEVSTVCRYSRVCRLLRFREWEMQRSGAAIEYYRDIYLDDENRAPRRRTFDQLGSLAAALAEDDVRLVVAMFPLFYKAPFTDYPLRDVHELVGRELRGRGVEFIDLLPAFDRHIWWQKFMVHPLDRHPSAEAIEIAGGYVLDELLTIR